MFATSALIVDQAWELLLALRLEICLFFAAVGAYYALFGNVMPKKAKLDKAKRFQAKAALDSDKSSSQEAPPVPTPRAAESSHRLKKAPSSPKSTLMLFKVALKTGNFDEAKRCFRELKAPWSTTTTPSQAPQQLVSQLIDVFCKEQQLAQLVPELFDVPLCEEAINVMLGACARQRDSELAAKVEKLGRQNNVTFSDRTYSSLLRCFSNSREHSRRVVEEMLTRDVELTQDSVVSMLAVCSTYADVNAADRILARLRRSERPVHHTVWSAIVRFYAEQEQYEKACDIYEQDLQKSLTAVADNQNAATDPRTERVVMTAALRCGRTDLATGLLESSPSDVANCISMIRNCAAVGNLKGAMEVFDTLRSSGTDLNSVVYNAVLDACVECRQMKEVEAWMAKTQQAGMADVVSYNTFIKAYLTVGDFKKARVVVEDMKRNGLQPNRVTFNELINHAVSRRSTREVECREQVWSLIDEMQAAGVKPNQVTCSILMKSLNEASRQQDIVRTMDLISDMEEPMDEVLLSSVVEACVRVGKPDLLSSKLKQLQDSASGLPAAANSSHTFGSLIKAYGYAKDVAGVWRCWKEMRNRHIKPTSITLGCMVEAVVSNGDTEGAFELIHEMQEDERCKSVLNSVIYCSVLKGFTREKKIHRAWAVYDEMRNGDVQPSIVTYNTLINACARCRCMDRVPALLDDMKRAKIAPNVITCSTMLKGHCQSGDVVAAFQVLKEMKTVAKLRPDEIAYNSLLDGCAQNGLVNEGLGVLEEMQNEGIPPSNFTLSVLIKLMSRARRLDAAFELVNTITKKYGFKPNVHVYTNLAQACVSNRSLSKGVDLLRKAVEEGLTPESRFYAILVRASIQQGLSEQAVGLLRAAMGLPGALPCLEAHKAAVCPRLDDVLVNEALLAVGDTSGKDLGIRLLADMKKHRAKVRIELSTQRRLMTGGGPLPKQAHAGVERRRNSCQAC